jgi:polyhydroxybutyrate depolymerase
MMMMMTRHIRSRAAATCATALAAALWSAPAVAGCGDAPDACRIDGGTYHIALPRGGRAGAPALMFLHGWGASGEAMLNMRGLVETALARGYAVIAPDGTPREGQNGYGWGFSPERPGPRDEIAFLRSVRDDAVARHGLDATRVLLGGFSIGGSMVSYLACAEPDAFAAYAPVAGAFWHPLPAECAGAVDLLHTHGWTDAVVPLEGRILRGGELDDEGVVAQGDIWEAMQVWRTANGCRPDAGSHGETGIFWRRSWHDCDSGRRLDFALFSGGHSIPEGWTDMALDWFEAR